MSIASLEGIKPVTMFGRSVGHGFPCLIVAEAGVNHNGDLATALKLVDVAAEAGADVVKFQTFKTESLVTTTAPKVEYQSRNTGSGESQYDMLKRLELPFDAFRCLMNRCLQRGLKFLSTPFDEESADFLAESGVEAFKVPSGELTNLPFLAHLARKGLPMIVSTGMASLAEVNVAVRMIFDAGNRQVVLLHCVSNYPADPSSVNLRAMQTLGTAFQIPVGFSDHTLGIEVALASVALGACLVEKHFTLDRGMPGPDHQASIEPGELAALVKGIRKVESAMGDGHKRLCAEESAVAAVARKSIIAARPLPAGATLAERDMVVRRPGTGLPPAMLRHLIGCRLKTSVKAGTPITAEMLELDESRFPDRQEVFRFSDYIKSLSGPSAAAVHGRCWFENRGRQ